MKLAVVGPGLIGTSVALAARRAWPDVVIIERDRGQPLDGVSAADIIVLAAPVDVIVEILTHQHPYLNDAVVTDTGSTKRAIVHAAREAGLPNFVGGHPMAGGTTTGPGEARADLFDNKPWMLVPHAAPPVAVERVRAFVEALGATPTMFEDDGSEHDRVMAAISHLPQVVASALMCVVGNSAGPAGLVRAGAGLRDTTRLAASSASVWQSILATNADELRPLLNRLSDDLRALAERIDDPETVAQLFETAARYRRGLDRTA